MRRFLILGHKAPVTPEFHLNDLPGAAGRLDVLCRAIGASLFLSHGIRRDTEVMLLLQDTVRMRISGQYVKRLNPDERSTAALIRRALAALQDSRGSEASGSTLQDSEVASAAGDPNGSEASGSTLQDSEVASAAGDPNGSEASGSALQDSGVASAAGDPNGSEASGSTLQDSGVASAAGDPNGSEASGSALQDSGVASAAGDPNGSEASGSARRKETRSTPGILVAPATIAETLDLLAREEATPIVLHEAGVSVDSFAFPEDPAFILSDHMDFSDTDEAALEGLPRISLGPTALHTSQAITIVHYLLDQREEDLHADLVLCHKVWGEPKAQLIKGLLEDFDIPVNLMMHAPPALYPMAVDGMAEVRVMVRPRDCERAQQIISDYFEKPCAE